MNLCISEEEEDLKGLSTSTIADLSKLSDDELREAHRDASNRSSRFQALQLSKKISINAFYGSIANKYCRWFSLVNAEAITTSGQLTIQWVQRDINTFLNKILGTKDVDFVIASDTDSAYLTLDRLVEKFCEGWDDDAICDYLDKVCNTKLQDIINKSFVAQGIYTNAMDATKLVMKREAIASSGVWTAKKRYILRVMDNEGFRYKVPEVKITGLEVVKSSTPGVCRKALKECCSIILTDDETALHDYVDAFYEEFLKMPFTAVAFPRGVSDLDKWVDPSTLWKPSTPIHVKGSIIYNNTLEKMGLADTYPPIYNGDKVKFAYLRIPNPLSMPVISSPGELPPEFDLDAYVDRDTQFQKTFIDPLKMITDVVGWTPQKIYTLTSFFE